VTRPEHRKIVDLPGLCDELAAAREQGRRIVFTNGCFDLLHAGHVRLLESAAELGDLLVVGLNGDASVRRLKGPERPFVPFHERAEILAALETVDLVVGFEEDTPANLIATVRPDVLVKGGDLSPDSIVGRETVESRGGRVVSIPLRAGRSTSALVEKIRGDGM
jgi:D-beta-D-heptose 7-phosphate kinase/D-beta-D-heptose 1-phosphate adenosyltransferase